MSTRTALLLALAPAFAAGSMLRQGGEPSVVVEARAAATEKWEKMDDFLETMFMISCKWKHTDDITGLVGSQTTYEKPGDATKFMAKTQAENVQGLRTTCDNMSGKGLTDCRNGCHERWGPGTPQATKCERKCETVYVGFNRRCKTQAEHLSVVYDGKLHQKSQREQCRDNSCPEFPHLWGLKEEESEGKVAAACAVQCPLSRLTAQCHKWNQEGAGSAVMQTQAEITCRETNTDASATACFSAASTGVKAEQNTCDAQAQAKCGTELGECMQKSAADFCQKRKTECSKAATETCGSALEKGLDAAKATCEKAREEAVKACAGARVHDAVSSDACPTEQQAVCQKECQDKCNLGKMHTCIGDIKVPDEDPAKEFCSDFWQLLKKTSGVDKKTGDPVVLLAPASATVHAT